MANRNIAVDLLMDEGLNLNMVLGAAEMLMQPLQIVENNIRERRQVPKNELFYEQTIPQYDDILFREHFRMSREAFEILTQRIANQRLNWGNQQIPWQKKILFFIWILAKQESFLACGDRFGLARSTAYYVFREIVELILELLPQHIRWPNNYETNVEVFRQRSRGFPGVVGAIDGCHIRIKQPLENAHDYYNRNKYHSIILQGTADQNLKFMDIYVGMPGRMHDARVFRNSPLYQRLTDPDNNVLPENFHLLGDSAYPLMVNLMTHFRDNGHLTDRQRRYNQKLSSIRSVIERAFGRLKGKFRRLKDLDVCTPETGTQVIAAACILHNFIIEIDNDDEEFGIDPNLQELEEDGQVFARENREAAVLKRNDNE